MKKLIYLLFAAALCSSAAAQDYSAYFMDGAISRTQFNPALAPTKGYIKAPVVGGMEFGIKGNLSLDKLLYPKENGNGLVTIFDATVGQIALDNFKPNNNTGISMRTNILGFGAYTSNRKNFWSFDMAARADIDAHMPFELFEFMKTGRETNIRNIGITAETYADASFNYSFAIGKRLYIGARVKFVAGLMRGDLNIDSFDITLGEDRWYAQAVGSLNMIGPKLKAEVGDEVALNDLNSAFDFKASSLLKPSGYGGAIDLGATYDVTSWLQLSAAITDLGFVSWSKSRMTTLTMKKDIEFTGVNVERGDDGSLAVTDNNKFDLNDLKFVVTDQADAKSMRRLTTQVNVGADFEFLNHLIGLGVLYNMQCRTDKTYHNLIGSFNLHAARWLGVSASYMLLDNKANAVGFALNIIPGSVINLYLGTDVLLSKKSTQYVPIKQSNMNFTFGIGVPIGKWGHRIARYEARDNMKAERQANKTAERNAAKMAKRGNL